MFQRLCFEATALKHARCNCHERLTFVWHGISCSVSRKYFWELFPLVIQHWPSSGFTAVVLLQNVMWLQSVFRVEWLCWFRLKAKHLAWMASPALASRNLEKFVIAWKQNFKKSQTVKTANKTKTIQKPKQGKPRQTHHLAVNVQHGSALERLWLLS